MIRWGVTMMWSGWGEYKGMKFMPEIKPISFLRSTQEISELCHSMDSPVFLTKNGYGDLVIMSMAAYEKLITDEKNGCNPQ